jgi:hypothetical protein
MAGVAVGVTLGGAGVAVFVAFGKVVGVGVSVGGKTLDSTVNV